ncbi:MAG: hypothetical protein AABX38_01620 [Candidatus Micrarchaeota archaeon]
MNSKILAHYLDFSTYTYPGLYLSKLKNDLPDEVRSIGEFVRRQIIHRSTLKDGNIGTNLDKKFGDMNKVAWYKQPEDDILTTASSMFAELYHRNSLGFIKNRKENDKLILTCRSTSILMASILKSKSIPCRVRSGHAPYFDMGELRNVSTDHWINQYWNSKEKRWITIDVDGSWSMNEPLNAYDLPLGKFYFPADSWLGIRSSILDQNKFRNAAPEKGLITVCWALFYDFHCLMNDEVIYLHVPEPATYIKFNKLSKQELEEIDNLAVLMQDPDKNFFDLQKIWETNKKFRLLKGGLL